VKQIKKQLGKVFSRVHAQIRDHGDPTMPTTQLVGEWIMQRVSEPTKAVINIADAQVHEEIDFLADPEGIGYFLTRNLRSLWYT